MAQGCKKIFTRPTPIIHILRYQDLSEGFQEGETVLQQGTYMVVM